MKQWISLLRAGFSEDMDLFQFKTKSKLGNISMILLMIAVFAFLSGNYTYMLLMVLEPLGIGYLVLALFITLSAFLTLIQAVYKSIPMIYDGKDNERLLVLPISKDAIIMMRLVKMITYEMLFDALFLAPAFIVYGYCTSQSIGYYLMALMYLVIGSILPTCLGAFIGYFIRNLASRFKKTKLIQTLFTLLFIALIYYFSFNLNRYLPYLLENAKSIGDVLMRLYFPAGLFVSLIVDFKIMDFIVLIGIHVIALGILLFIIRWSFNRMLSQSNHGTYKKQRLAKSAVIQTSKTKALVKREFNTIFNSSVYLMNCCIGSLLMVGFTAYFLNQLHSYQSMLPEEILSMIHKGFVAVILFFSSITSTTYCSISMEKRGWVITKSLPVSGMEVFKAKLIVHNLCCTMIFTLVDIVYMLMLRPSVFDCFVILGTTILFPYLIGLFGLLINIKFYDFEFSNDAQVVKQGKASMCAVFGGMMIALAFGLPVALTGYNELVVGLEMMICLLLNLLGTYYLKKNAEKLYRGIY